MRLEAKKKVYSLKRLWVKKVWVTSGITDSCYWSSFEQFSNIDSMEHAKKIILVPHDLLLKINQQKQNQSELTNDLDAEMTTLLDNEELGEK